MIEQGRLPLTGPRGEGVKKGSCAIARLEKTQDQDPGLKLILTKSRGSMLIRLERIGLLVAFPFIAILALGWVRLPGDVCLSD